MAICLFKNPLLCFIIIPWSPIKFVEGDICDEFLLPKKKMNSLSDDSCINQQINNSMYKYQGKQALHFDINTVLDISLGYT